jgi:hypothetical protein
MNTDTNANIMEEDSDEGSSSDDYDDEYDDENENDSFDEDDVSSDDSSLGMEMDVEAGRLWDALHAGAGGGGGTTPGGQPVPPPPMAQTPEQVIQGHLTALSNGSSTVLKLDDAMVQHIVQIPYQGTSELTAAAAKQGAVDHLYSNTLHAIQNSNNNNNNNNNNVSGTIKHVILGTSVLQLWTPQQQVAIYHALAAEHSSSITYWKLGTNDVDELCGIPADQLLSILISTTWPCLTEFQIRGLEFYTIETIHHLVQLLRSVSSTIKLFNILGMVLSTNVIMTSCGVGGALLDPLLQAVETIPQLDDVQLHRMALETNNDNIRNLPHYDSTKTENMLDMTPLVSSQALLHMLQVKPKWWRLTLDGMGLQDSHLQVLGSQLVSCKDCKMNDLLSLRNNPSLSSRALSQLYHVCINKQRMGLVLSDDGTLNALVDLVRPLNNLHRRLEYKDDQGNYSNVDQWLAWFQVLSNLPWLDETRKLNYIWFTLLEQPSMIATAIHTCSKK